MSRSERRRHSFSILMIDIDHFKRINDTHGHQTGDDLLRHFAGVLKSVLRSCDVAARYGGEEFLVLLTETGPPGALLLAERLPGGAGRPDLAVALLQFCVPFVLLLFRDLKRRPLTLAAVALLLVLARWIDNYWLVKPAFSPDHLTIGWLDVALPIAMGGLWIAYFLWQLGRRPLLPVHDRGLIQEAEAEFAKERASS